MGIALYIHIPFCARKCAYCDFASFANRLGELPGYLSSLEAEMALYPSFHLDTVYIGGGTPSLLAGEQMNALLKSVRSHFQLSPNAEISMEANPGTLDLDRLSAYRAAGINRLSLGAQAAQPQLLQSLGRIHNWGEVEESATWAREAGFKNLNLDLMYGLPGQTILDWTDTLEKAMNIGPEHLSAYSLILEEDTPLYERKDLVFPSDELVIDMQREATRRLEAGNLFRYEISNYAKPGFECRHNITYWTRGDYLGLGVAAHSLLDGVRFANSKALPSSREERIALSEDDAFEERVMLGTRMTRGIPLDGLPMKKVEKLQRAGLIKTDRGLLSCTQKGFELHNQVVLELLS